MLCKLTVLFSGQTFSPKSSLTTNILKSEYYNVEVVKKVENADSMDNLDLDCDDIIINIKKKKE